MNRAGIIAAEITQRTASAQDVITMKPETLRKAVDRGMRIDEVYLLHKFGGRSGEYIREEEK